MKLTWICDPGHGWLVVPLNELRALNIVDRISRYSYLKDGLAYLEEDCDATLYFTAHKAAGTVPAYIEKHTDKRHPIRSYSTFKA